MANLEFHAITCSSTLINFDSLRDFRFMASTDEFKVVSPYIRFFAGAALSGFLVLLLLLYSEIGWHEITNPQWGLLSFMIVSCGLLSVKLGAGFMETLINGFGNSGL